MATKLNIKNGHMEFKQDHIVIQINSKGCCCVNAKMRSQLMIMNKVLTNYSVRSACCSNMLILNYVSPNTKKHTTETILNVGDVEAACDRLREIILENFRAMPTEVEGVVLNNPRADGVSAKDKFAEFKRAVQDLKMFNN